ncbi:MAG: hypothetical protein H0V66_11670 [Bdellovibrionales bacterium]|nr:hypothetical protein [Bdellovibrionales bacterium]
MYFRTLGFILLMVTQVGFAQGRKPAVEDFVGIEIEHPEGTPQGTEGLFNFEKEITKFEEVKPQPAKPTVASTSFTADGPGVVTTALTVALILGLPGLIWFFMMNHLRQKAQVESASNIEVLEKYRRDRQEAKKAEQTYKKSA